MKNEFIAGITTIAGSSLGSITVATVPTAVIATAPATGLAGWLGFTTTATTIVAAPVTLPIGGVVAVGALLTYGGYQAYKFLNKKSYFEGVFEGNSIPKWAREKGAYTVEYSYVKSELEGITSIKIFDRERKIITNTFNDEEINRIKQILPTE